MYENLSSRLNLSECRHLEYSDFFSVISQNFVLFQTIFCEYQTINIKILLLIFDNMIESIHYAFIFIETRLMV